MSAAPNSAVPTDLLRPIKPIQPFPTLPLHQQGRFGADPARFTATIRAIAREHERKKSLEETALKMSAFAPRTWPQMPLSLALALGFSHTQSDRTDHHCQQQMHRAHRE